MIYILILITNGSRAAASAGYEFYSLENCQKAVAAAEELSGWGRGVHGICVQK
jgi:hypothetical protein